MDLGSEHMDATGLNMLGLRHFLITQISPPCGWHWEEKLRERKNKVQAEPRTQTFYARAPEKLHIFKQALVVQLKTFLHLCKCKRQKKSEHKKMFLYFLSKQLKSQKKDGVRLGAQEVNAR